MENFNNTPWRSRHGEFSINLVYIGMPYSALDFVSFLELYHHQTLYVDPPSFFDGCGLTPRESHFDASFRIFLLTERHLTKVFRTESFVSPPLKTKTKNVKNEWNFELVKKRWSWDILVPVNCF